MSCFFNLISGVEQILTDDVWLKTIYFNPSKFYFVEGVAFKLLLLIFTPRYNNKENPVLMVGDCNFFKIVVKLAALPSFHPG
ncbi:hypothetical protein DRW42_10905 [Pedobacter miscanthi]|uniref:Uncharacterized protein n=1 Tax=Pedobacter miscanthi TaxID=2259170 RepID=A0A366L1G8_9SPHI|nr:hypothetical protein DRW42_10905 [Pedobacter miscanthi]